MLSGPASSAMAKRQRRRWWPEKLLILSWLGRGAAKIRRRSAKVLLFLRSGGGQTGKSALEAPPERSDPREHFPAQATSIEVAGDPAEQPARDQADDRQRDSDDCSRGRPGGYPPPGLLDLLLLHRKLPVEPQGFRPPLGRIDGGGIGEKLVHLALQIPDLPLELRSPKEIIDAFLEPLTL